MNPPRFKFVFLFTGTVCGLMVSLSILLKEDISVNAVLLIVACFSIITFIMGFGMDFTVDCFVNYIHRMEERHKRDRDEEFDQADWWKNS